MTKTEDLSRWFDDGVRQRATHMVVVCDTFDWSDYPVYVKPGEDPQKIFNENNGPNMTKAMECYALFKPKAEQIGKRRNHDFTSAPAA